MVFGPATKQKAASVLQRSGAKLEQHARPALSLLLLLFFVALLGLSSKDYLWYDELVLVRVAGLPHWHDIWAFYASGLDTIGLLYALILHPLLKLPASAEITSRLPAIVAFLLMMLCAFAFVRRRYPAGYAFAMLFMLMSLPLNDYAVFAKSYAIEFAGLTFAMICWQAALDARHRPWSLVGLWFGLALALYSHSFAIFLFVPFAAAQAVRDFRRNKLDWPVWIALASFPVALLPVLRGQLLASKLYGANFWSQPSSTLMRQTYIDYFLKDWRLVLILFFAAVMVTALFRDPLPSTDSAHRSKPGFSPPEWTFVLMLATLPIYVLPASYLLHAYRADYVMSFAIGLAILLVAVFAEHAQRTQAAGVLLLVFFAWATLRTDLRNIPEGLHVVAHPGNVHAQLEASYNSTSWVNLLEQTNLSVAVGDHLLYTRLEYYSQPDLKRRLFFLTDIAEVNSYPLSNTSQMNFLLFGKLLSYRTMDVGSFLPTHPHFLLASGTSDGTLWLPPYLLNQQRQGNASLQLLGPDYNTPNVYDVQFTRLPAFPAPHALPK
jgi:hypothetical protein